MQVFVKTLTGKTLVIGWEEDTTFADLKQKIQDLHEIPAEKQKIILEGRIPADNQTLLDAKVMSTAVLHVIVSN